MHHSIITWVILTGNFKKGGMETGERNGGREGWSEGVSEGGRE